MSRYMAINKATGRHIAWGYDRLDEYFLTEFWTPAEADRIEEAQASDIETATKLVGDLPGFKTGLDSEVVFSIMSRTTTHPHPEFPEKLEYSNAEMLALMQRYPEIPEEHKVSVDLGSPF